MKKLNLLFICAIMFLSTFLLGCNNKSNNIAHYNDLKLIIYNLQEKNEDLYRNEFIIFGTAHSQYNGTENGYKSHYIKLQDIILTENCIMTRPETYNSYYWFYFDIEKIEFNNEIIWQQ